ncbi:MAG TPA: branched-chain amino acid ABC transporter permease [Candidatus Eisenbacteria bacterium]|nr:branched-chain amino acid ABC transporter permease [Candidatus Eisenbacteria bacterium]
MFGALRYHLGKSPLLQVAVYLGPFVLFPILDRNAYHVDVLTNVAIYVILAMGLNVVIGFAGLLNLGYAAFFAIGAYTYALLNLHTGCPFWAGLPAAGTVAMLFGFLIAVPSIRVRGDYLAITTLGFGEIVRILFNNLDTWTGGPNGLLGIDRPTFFGYRFSVSPVPYFYLALVLAAVIAYLLFRLSDSKIGRALVAIREDELAAKCMGVPALRIKLYAFGLSSFIAGLAGAVFASKQTIVTPDSFDFVLSVLILAMVVLGGMGNIWGSALGALVLGTLPEILRGFAGYRMLIFGLLMILMMIFRPQGMLGGALIRRELRPRHREPRDGPA